MAATPSKITPEQVDAWLELPAETQGLEFKEAKTQFDSKSLAEYCASIANAGGGRLVLGLTDKPPRQVVGTKACRDVDGARRGVYDKIGHLVQAQEVEHPNGRVVVFDVPSRMRGSVVPCDGKYLVRVGSSNVAMNPQQLRDIFNEGQPDWLQQPARRDLSAGEVVELLDTQTYFELLERPYPTTREGVIENLMQARLVEEEIGTYLVPRIGAVLLAKNLGDFDLEEKAPRLIIYEGVGKEKTVRDHIGRRGYAVGFRGLVSAVMSALPQNELIGDALREERPLVPRLVIRELVANALVHQDFAAQGRSTIQVFSNRVEISNPGVPVIDVARFVDFNEARNARLATHLRRLRICEEKGSGIDNALTQIEVHQLPAPEFRESLGRTEVTIFGPRPFKDMSADDRARACFQHCALQWVIHEAMTNQSLRKRFDLTDVKGDARTVSVIIADTVERGWVKRDETAGESRRHARYVPTWA